MLKETQQLIIVTLGIIAITCILKEYHETALVGMIVGILGGFLTGKKIFVDPNHTITEVEGEEDGQ